MRLAFDLDGTVADMQRALAREARELFPEIDPATLPRSFSPTAPEDGAAPAGAPFAMDALSSRQMKDLWRAVHARVNFWETLQEIEPGALARLYDLVRQRRWEVIFLTSRPETAGDTAQVQSHRWLEGCGYRTPAVFVVHGSRGKIAASLALDIVVDDRPENCLDVAIDSQARPILVWRGDEERVPSSARQLGIASVASIAEVLSVLESVDGESSSVGLLDRLKAVFGLKRRSTRPRPVLPRPAPSA